MSQAEQTLIENPQTDTPAVLAYLAQPLSPESDAFRQKLLAKGVTREMAQLVAVFRGHHLQIVPVSISTHADQLGTSVAEAVFDLTNNPARQAEREELYGRHKSLSVGDLVLFGGCYYLCQDFGWERYTKAYLDSLVFSFCAA